MTEEMQIKLLFEKFTEKFEENIFTLIAKFAEINDAFSRVQQGLDFLGKLKIQTAENKQIMTKLEKAFKNLERKLRDMSVGGFRVPEKETIDTDEGLGDFLSATVSQSAVSEEGDLSEFGSIEELPSMEDIMSKKEKTAPKPKEEEVLATPVPKPKEEEVLTTPVPKPIASATSNPTTASEPLSKEKPELTPTPEPPKDDLTPTPEPPKIKSEPILKEGIESIEGLSPMPKPPIEEAEEVTKTEPEEERITNIMGPQDVWYNLIIEIKGAPTNEQIALSLGIANNHLKRFVKFHKVLFELLKMASQFRKKGVKLEPSPEDKATILENIDTWKIALH